MNERELAVAFDLDDTLYPERSYVLSGFRAVAEFVSERDQYDEERIYDFLRDDFDEGVRGTNFDRLIDRTGVSISVSKLVEIYRTHEPDISLFPDAQRCLDEFGENPVSIITDGRVEKQRKKIDSLDLRDHSDLIYISDDFGPECWKPSTVMFERFLEDVDVPACRTVYVGDNPTKDFSPANELGMRSIYVRRPGGEYSAEEPSTELEEPTTAVTDLDTVPDIVRRWEACE